MKLSDTAIAMLKHFEGLKLEPYYCSAGVLTVGYGHTGPDVHEGVSITEEEAEALLRQDMETFEHAVLRKTKGVELTQNEFDALVVLTYNIGEGNFGESSVLRHLKAGDLNACADSFMKWVKARQNGELVPLKGLYARRGAERAHFLGDDWLAGSEAGKAQYEADCKG